MNTINVGLIGIYMVAVLSFLVTPGPVTLLVIRAGIAGGMNNALRTICGTNAASLLLIFASALLIKGLLVVEPRVFSVIRLLGCLYIIRIAWGMLGDALGKPPSNDESVRVGAPSGGFKRGFALAISNPKDIIFFASFLPQFIRVLPSANQSLCLLTVLWIVLDFGTLSGLAYFVSSVAKPSLQKQLILVSSALLLLIGVGGVGQAAYELLCGTNARGNVTH